MSDLDELMAEDALIMCEGEFAEDCLLAFGGGEPFPVRCVIERSVSGRAMSSLPRGSSPTVGKLTDAAGRVWDVRPRLPVREAEQARRLAAAHVAASRLPAGVDIEAEAGVAILILIADQQPGMRR